MPVATYAPPGVLETFKAVLSAINGRSTGSLPSGELFYRKIISNMQQGHLARLRMESCDRVWG
jgi:hypothetical protein